MKKKHSLHSLLLILLPMGLGAHETILTAPNNRVMVTLQDAKKSHSGWELRIQQTDAGDTTLVCTIPVGLTTEQQSFDTAITLLRVGKVKEIHESYTAVHGKRSYCTNEGRELVFTFQNKEHAQCVLIVRAYNDGVVFRYALDRKQSKCKDGNVILDEATAYCIPETTQRWLEKWNPANEGLYTEPSTTVAQESWGYPTLFSNAERELWWLVSESDVDGNNCASRLNNTVNADAYQVTQPTDWEGRGTGAVHPVIRLPWKSPWRVVIVGTLATIVESTLVDDVARPSTLKDTEWIKPGAVSWNYWSDNHGTRSYETVCAFADLAQTMQWPYTLLDWEWDAMRAQPELASNLPNGGNLEDAIDYIKSKGIRPLMWYNSGGSHTWVEATPKDRMLTHENRVEEFTRLTDLGVKGVKIDFFESEKQQMMQYYLDILEDAADFKMIVYFHGCLVPRGWARTYPHLMTYEGVRGAEWYNNGPEFTTTAMRHNCILPYTRNVVGAMDYTPVTFTNSQYPHLTSYGHELALGVVFESALQHMADRPEGYLSLPSEIRSFLSHLPTAWDDTKFVDGQPGEKVVMARRAKDTWYIGAITSNERSEEDYILRLPFLPEGKEFRLILISDGKHDQAFSIKEFHVDKNSEIPVHLLRRGGFAGRLSVL